MTHSTTVLVPRAPRTSDGEALALQLGALGRRLRACGARLVHLPPPHGRPFLRERLLPWRSASGPRALVFCQDTEDAPVALWHGLASHGFLVTRAPASLAPGDVVRLGDVLLVAHRDAPRGRRFCRALARATRLRVEEVQLDPSFPSLESAVAALPDGALVFAPNAFTPLGRFQLRQLFPRQRHLLVPHGEALAVLGERGALLAPEEPEGRRVWHRLPQRALDDAGRRAGRVQRGEQRRRILRREDRVVRLPGADAGRCSRGAAETPPR